MRFLLGRAALVAAILESLLPLHGIACQRRPIINIAKTIVVKLTESESANRTRLRTVCINILLAARAL